jgi:hypothetical protein
VLQHGTPAAKPQGVDRRSAAIEDHAALIHATIERRSDITLHELRLEPARAWSEHQLATLWRFFSYHRITP